MPRVLNAIRTIDPDGYRCPCCKYDLSTTAIDSGRLLCPECGSSSRVVPETEIGIGYPPRTDLGEGDPPLEYPSHVVEVRSTICGGCSKRVGGEGLGPPPCLCPHAAGTCWRRIG